MTPSIDAAAPGLGGVLARGEASLPRWRRARRWAFYASVRGLATAARSLPRPLARGLLAELGVLAWATRPGDRRLALQQLQRALPGLSAEERHRLGRRATQRLGHNLADTLHGVRALPPSEEGRRRLQAAAAEGRGLLVLMAHLGAWELAGPVLADLVPPFGAITANPHNARVDRWLRDWRAQRGVRSFDRAREALGAARWVKRGGTLALLADHRSAVATTPVPWFGAAAPTALGPARLARWTGAPALVVSVRAEGTEHRLVVGPRLDFEDGETEVAFLTRLNAALEREILAQPEAWTWFHDRYGQTDGART